jgi:flagellar biosynthesis anti-sigma factor FlgM
MQIDPKIQLPADVQAENVKNTRTGGTQSPVPGKTADVKPASGQDTVSLSSKHVEVQTLTANLANVPEVRTGRVTALQQQVSSGQYHPNSQKVADAIVADQFKVSARA